MTQTVVCSAFYRDRSSMHSTNWILITSTLYSRRVSHTVFLFKHILLAIRQQSYKYNYIKSFCRMKCLQMKLNENEWDGHWYRVGEKRLDWQIYLWIYPIFMDISHTVIQIPNWINSCLFSQTFSYPYKVIFHKHVWMIEV